MLIGTWRQKSRERYRGWSCSLDRNVSQCYSLWGMYFQTRNHHVLNPLRSWSFRSASESTLSLAIILIGLHRSSYISKHTNSMSPHWSYCQSMTLVSEILSGSVSLCVLVISPRAALIWSHYLVGPLPLCGRNSQHGLQYRNDVWTSRLEIWQVPVP